MKNDIIAETDTNKLVTISEFLSPISFPNKPDKIEPKSGRNNKANSIINLLNYQFVQLLLIQSFYNKLQLLPNQLQLQLLQL